MNDGTSSTLFRQIKKINLDKKNWVELDVLSQDGKTLIRAKNEREIMLKRGMKCAGYYGFI